jgi:hypothetical protein
MSTALTNNDVALPHAGLLAFFLSSTPTTRFSDSNYTLSPHYKSNATSTNLVSDTDDSKDEDEESKCGFWGEWEEYKNEPRATSLSKIRRSHRGLFAFCCFCCAMSICISGAFGTFFAVDVVLTQFDMGTGMSRWMVHGNAVESVGSFEVSSSDPIIRATAKTYRYADVLLSRVAESSSTRTASMALHQGRNHCTMHNRCSHTVCRGD